MQQRESKDQTIVSVKMVPTKRKGEHYGWSLLLRAYPVMVDGKKTETREFLHRVITTPIWDITRKKRENKDGTISYHVKRDINGVILCQSAIDNEACLYADRMRKQRQREFDVAPVYDGHEDEVAIIQAKHKGDFIAYFEEMAEWRHPNARSKPLAWYQSIAMLKKFNKNKPLVFERIDIRYINNFRSWMLQQYNPRYKKKKVRFSDNTISTYFMLFRAALKQAFNDGFLETDLSAKAKAIHKKPGQREAFTMPEIQSLYNTPCVDSTLKRAALFSALTGLRLGDIRNLTWEQLRMVNGKWQLDIVQNKTNQTDYLPISDQAYEMCGERKKSQPLIFPNIPATAWFKKNLEQWIKKAGIERHMTFHCFRHTFATLQLENGTDIYTIKEMLGHTSVNTTQIYSHIVDPAKRRAANMIHIEGLTIEF